MDPTISQLGRGLRAGLDSDTAFSSIVPPIYLGTNYAFAGLNNPPRYDYSRSGNPTRTLLADALAISAATGGSQLRAVDAVIDAERERAALRREVRALASQAQTSAVVLVVLPVGFAVAVAAVDPRVRAFYLGSALGVGCLVVGCLLDAAGAWLMYRLVRGVS